RFVRWASPVVVSGVGTFTPELELAMSTGEQHGGAEDQPATVVMRRRAEIVALSPFVPEGVVVELAEVDPRVPATSYRVLFSGRLDRRITNEGGRSDTVRMTVKGWK